MAPRVRLCVSLVIFAVAALTLGRPASAASRGARNVSPEGAVYTFGTGPAGEAVLSIDSGELHVEKAVSADGSSVLTLRAGADELRLELSQDRADVSSPEGKASVGPDASDENGPRSVRMALARSRAVQLFRVLATQVGAAARKKPFDEAVTLSGAVIGQLAGDPGALRGFAQRYRSTKAGLRPAGLRRISDCWGQYEQFLLWAYDQYAICLTQGLWRINYVSYCDFQYTMRAESAWFQFLACSAFPIT